MPDGSVESAAWLAEGSAAWVMVMVGAVVVGLVLWGLGGKLARFGVVVTGFVFGGLAGTTAAVLMTQPGQQPWAIAVGIGSAVAGALLAGLLFRLWMGVSGAVVLGLVVPGAVLVWTGSRPDTTAAEQGVAEVRASAEAVAERAGVRGPDAVASGFSDEQVQEIKSAAAERVRGLLSSTQEAWRTQADVIAEWWASLSAELRTVVVGGAAGGVLVGLVLGMVAPAAASMLQTALAGSVLVFFAGRELLTRYVGFAEGLLPGSPRGVLLTVGLITVLGLLVQWTAVRRRDDK